MYINLSKIGLEDQSKFCTQNCFQKIGKLHKFATTNNNFERGNYFRHVSSYNVHVLLFSANSG